MSIGLHAFAADYQTVLIVSVDALHPAAVSSKNCPNIFRLAQDGYYTDKAVGTNPPKTLISHTSIMTGMTPEQNGKKDNDWKEGMAAVKWNTLLTFAKSKGYQTEYFYSKKKLGYLAKDADIAKFSGEDAVDSAVSMLDTSKKQFVFLHISGLDTEGPISGWLSPGYIDEFSFIDEQLGALFKKVQRAGSYLIIVTSDHAGHAKIHGSDDPEDFKRPIVIYSSMGRIKTLPETALKAEGFKPFVEELINNPSVGEK